jgi:hypothetical protein
LSRRISIAFLAVAGWAVAQTPVEIHSLAVTPDSGVVLDWFAEPGKFYDLETSDNLTDWFPAEGFPRGGTGPLMQASREWRAREFYRVASAATATAFYSPEVMSYRQATGITLEAAAEIDHFLRLLRIAGVEPAFLWVGGTRYGSISGNTAHAVIGGSGTVTGTLGARGERHETFSGGQTIRFANPLRTGSQKRVGYFAGAAPSTAVGVGQLMSGGSVTNPRGPSLSAAWGGGNFRVFSESGVPLNHSGFGGYAKPGAFLPFIGGAYDGFYSVLCGIGKSAGRSENPLRYRGMPQDLFPGNEFVNDQPDLALGADFLGTLHFAVATAADLTDNARAYELVSIPKRCGFGPYGVQTAVAFLGDSITYGYNHHVWDSDGQMPPHKAGGQWNRQALGLLGNDTGEATGAQIKYFEGGTRHALDSRTWDHVFYICGSGGHYAESSHVTQNPLTQEAKNRIDAWVREYHEKIAVPAAETGASVVQMTYIYGCPDKFSSVINPEIYRAFSDHFVSTQRQYALSAGFPIFDVYMIPQLHAPLADFYRDTIHPNGAGNRLIAQEFAATVANPGSRIPRSLTRPAITGTAKQGSTLTATRGSWAFTPASYGYQWMRGATDIAGATSATRVLQAADVGSNLSCRVIASNIHGSAERTSGHTAKVAP